MFCFLPAVGFNFVLGALMADRFNLSIFPAILISIAALLYFGFMLRALFRSGKHWRGNLVWKILGLSALSFELLGSSAPIVLTVAYYWPLSR